MNGQPPQPLTDIEKKKIESWAAKISNPQTSVMFWVSLFSTARTHDQPGVTVMTEIYDPFGYIITGCDFITLNSLNQTLGLSLSPEEQAWLDNAVNKGFQYHRITLYRAPSGKSYWNIFEIAEIEEHLAALKRLYPD